MDEAEIALPLHTKYDRKLADNIQKVAGLKETLELEGNQYNVILSMASAGYDGSYRHLKNKTY